MSKQFIPPLDTWVMTRDFYFKSWLYVGGQHGGHDGIDPTGTLGKPVRASQAGVATAHPYDYYNGLWATVDHADGARTLYRHFSRHVLPVGVPTTVTQGQTIGEAGSTGVSTGPHVHFDIQYREIRSPEAIARPGGWYAHDPALLLLKEDDSLTQEQIDQLNATDAALKQVDAQVAEILRQMKDTDTAIKQVQAAQAAQLQMLKDTDKAVKDELAKQSARLTAGGH